MIFRPEERIEMSNYEVHASPSFKVSCPKHRNYLPELRNGMLGEKLWWCKDCERPYHLKPTVMKLGTFNREEVDRQLKEQTSE